MTNFDYRKAGTWVCLRNKPSRFGITTGKYEEDGTYVKVEVNFGPNDVAYKSCDALQEVVAKKSLIQQATDDGIIGSPRDLRQVLTLEKISGELTNVFYSMGSSATDFYPHQFKPALQFIESHAQGLLIADEVGLGKTIESMYIWKELLAREQAQRLLIICPAMLREKWRMDIKNRFNMTAEVIDSLKTLAEVLEDVASPIGKNKKFIYIVSLESLRIRIDDDEIRNAKTRKASARIARTLLSSISMEESQSWETLDSRILMNRVLESSIPLSGDASLFDLVIIDEAHYMRNSATASHHIGQLLRCVSRYLLLLTATPIQIENKNLFNLLKLIDRERFDDHYAFEQLVQANEPIINALRAIATAPPDVQEVARNIRQALKSPYFKNDKLLRDMLKRLPLAEKDPDEQSNLSRLIYQRSLLSRHMCRSRKREVMTKIPERKPQPFKTKFSPLEANIYNAITAKIRERFHGELGMAFSLISHQRQMASCLVEAIRNWGKNTPEDHEQERWEDLGDIDSEQLSNGNYSSQRIDAEDIHQLLYEVGCKNGYGNDDGDRESVIQTVIQELENHDCKYERLSSGLKEVLSGNSREKIIIFAFFRHTLQYLQKRLEEEDYQTFLIMGSMNDKDAVLNQFREHEGPAILLSSEVGSEGIDLQFCHYLVNYDIPWNPMRLEQRIGRIDRLGQKSETLSIATLIVENSIEDKMLMRLYDRIDIFKRSIGDIEDILGDTVRQLRDAFFNNQLTDDDRKEKANQEGLVLENNRQEKERLEQEAVNLFGLSDYLIKAIGENKDQGRWIDSGDLKLLVFDFFKKAYPGTQIIEDKENDDIATISLSHGAQVDLDFFIKHNKKLTENTFLHKHPKMRCSFDPKSAGRIKKAEESISQTHPLVQWILHCHGKDSEENKGHIKKLHRLAYVKMTSEQTGGIVDSGDYVFVVHHWFFEGGRPKRELAYAVQSLEDKNHRIGRLKSEELIVKAAREAKGTGTQAPENIKDALEACNRSLCEEFEKEKLDFEAENENRCNQDITSAKNHSTRRLKVLGKMLQQYKEEKRENLIRMIEGQIRPIEVERDVKLRMIKERRKTSCDYKPIFLGVITVE